MFVPPQAALNAVGLRKADLGDDDSIYRLISANEENIKQRDSQNAVCVYILRMRGAEIPRIAKRLNYDESTVQRKIAEGMAIIRTGNVDRAISAVRTGRLSIKVVDDITKGAKTQAEKLAALEAAALGSYIQSNFVQEVSGAAPQLENVTALVEQLSTAATNDSVPVIMSEIVSYMPTVTEGLGLVRKTRTPGTPDSGPYGLEYHFSRALEDVKAIQKAADGEPYIPTEQDLAALMSLCSFVGIDLSAPMFASAQ